MTIKWEYSAALLLIHSTKAILGNFGKDGRELITIPPDPTGGNHVGYFKRPRAN